MVQKFPMELLRSGRPTDTSEFSPKMLKIQQKIEKIEANEALSEKQKKRKLKKIKHHWPYVYYYNYQDGYEKFLKKLKRIDERRNGFSYRSNWDYIVDSLFYQGPCWCV